MDIDKENVPILSAMSDLASYKQLHCVYMYTHTQYMHKSAYTETGTTEKICMPWELPGHPVVRTQHFHCHGPGSSLGWGTRLVCPCARTTLHKLFHIFTQALLGEWNYSMWFCNGGYYAFVNCTTQWTLMQTQEFS